MNTGMRFSLGSLCLSAALLAGCGGGADDKKWTKLQKPVFPAGGEVTYKGSPVADASIVFRSNDPSAPVSASGKSDSSGRFTLMTYQAGDGAVAGKHQVIVIKAEVEGGDPSYYDTSSPNYGKTPPKTTTRYLVPQKYSTFEKSGLSADISESGKNHVALELKD